MPRHASVRLRETRGIEEAAEVLGTDRPPNDWCRGPRTIEGAGDGDVGLFVNRASDAERISSVVSCGTMGQRTLGACAFTPSLVWPE